MRAFSRDSLQHYIPVIQQEVRSAVRDWLRKDGCVLVYPEMKRLMFRVAMRILLGFQPEQIKTDEGELVEAFEEMIKNLFSLPIDVPFSGLYRVSSPNMMFFYLHTLPSFFRNSREPCSPHYQLSTPGQGTLWPGHFPRSRGGLSELGSNYRAWNARLWTSTPNKRPIRAPRRRVDFSLRSLPAGPESAQFHPLQNRGEHQEENPG